MGTGSLRQMVEESSAIKAKTEIFSPMIRVIKKKTDYSKLGILMVNIDEKTIREIFDSVGGNLNSNFYVLMNDILIFGPKEKENYDVSKDIIGSPGRKMRQRLYAAKRIPWCIKRSHL